MNAVMRAAVHDRAGNACEYCHSRQDDEPFFRYQVEHIIAKQHGGEDGSENLALACPHCNLHKGPNLAGLDPLDGSLVALFHPRSQHWADHFRLNGPRIEGMTPAGRATVRVLDMNDPFRVEARAALVTRQPPGAIPPDEESESSGA